MTTLTIVLGGLVGLLLGMWLPYLDTPEKKAYDAYLRELNRLARHREYLINSANGRRKKCKL